MNTVIELLRNVGAKLNTPAPDDLIKEIQDRYQITIPTAARDLYAAANGANGEFGNWMWQFWPIDSADIRLSDFYKTPKEYKVEDREIDPQKYIRFFDVLIDAPLYVYCADPKSKYFGEVLGFQSDEGGLYAFIATASVSDFLCLLIDSKADEAILCRDNVS